jgi:hypothetical protein
MDGQRPIIRVLPGGERVAQAVAALVERWEAGSTVTAVVLCVGPGRGRRLRSTWPADAAVEDLARLLADHLDLRRTRWPVGVMWGVPPVLVLEWPHADTPEGLGEAPWAAERESLVETVAPEVVAAAQGSTPPAEPAGTDGAGNGPRGRPTLSPPRPPSVVPPLPRPVAGQVLRDPPYRPARAPAAGVPGSSSPRPAGWG